MYVCDDHHKVCIYHALRSPAAILYNSAVHYTDFLRFSQWNLTELNLICPLTKHFVTLTAMTNNLGELGEQNLENNFSTY